METVDQVTYEYENIKIIKTNNDAANAYFDITTNGFTFLNLDLNDMCDLIELLTALAEDGEI